MLRYRSANWPGTTHGTAVRLAWWKDEQKRRAAASAERSAAKKAAKASAAPEQPTGEPPAGTGQNGSDLFHGRKTDRTVPAPEEPAATEQELSASAAKAGAPAAPVQENRWVASVTEVPPAATA